MACNCTLYECLGFVEQYNNCPEFLTIDLAATETGTWSWKYEFNGRWFGGTIDVTNGTDIVLPWVFNEQYVHLIEFYKIDGSLFNDTCYKLDTSKIAGSYTTPSVAETKYLNVTITAGMLSYDGDGNQVVTISAIAGRTIIGVAEGNQFYNNGSFTQGGIMNNENYFTLTNGAAFVAGQKITLLFA